MAVIGMEILVKKTLENDVAENNNCSQMEHEATSVKDSSSLFMFSVARNGVIFLEKSLMRNLELLSTLVR